MTKIAKDHGNDRLHDRMAAIGQPERERERKRKKEIKERERSPRVSPPSHLKWPMS